MPAYNESNAHKRPSLNKKYDELLIEKEQLITQIENIQIDSVCLVIENSRLKDEIDCLTSWLD